MIGLIKNNWIKSYIVKYLLFEYIIFTYLDILNKVNELIR